MYDYAIRHSYDDDNDDYIVAVRLQYQIYVPHTVRYKFSNGNYFLIKKIIVYH